MVSSRPRRRGDAAVLAVVVSGCVGALVACAAPQTPGPVPQPIRLAALLPLSGGSQASGEAMRAAAQMTVDELNADGGVLGRPLELVAVDDRCDPETAVKAANDVVAQGVVVSVGGYCSSAVVPTLPIFDAADVPMVIPAANSSDLLAPGFPGVFLLNPTVVDEAAVAVPWLAELGADSAVFVHDGTSYSLTLAQASDAVARRGGTVRSLGLLEATQGSGDLRSIAQGVVASGAQAVYHTGYEPDAVQLVEDLRAVGYRGLFVGADGVVGEDYLMTAPDVLGREVYATIPPVAQFGDASVQEWAGRLNEATGHEALPYTMQIADGVTLAADAISRAGSTDDEAVRSAIASTDGLALLTGECRFDDSQVLSSVPFTLVRAGPGTAAVAHDRRDARS